jgi:hypothetical protein
MLKVLIIANLFLLSSVFAIDIEKIKNDISVIEKKDISGNIIKSKANSDENIVDIQQNSSEIQFDIPEKTKEVVPTVNLNNKELLYFTLMQDVEKSREALNMTSAMPNRVSQFSLVEKEQKNLNSSSSVGSNANIEKNNSTARYVGICQFDSTYDIADALTINVPCKIDNKIVLLNLTLTPNNKNYELNGIGNFLMFDSYNNGSYSKRVFLDGTMSGIKNNANTSRNIASYYDTRKIQKILGVTAKEMSKALADGTKQTFEDYRDYNTNEQVSYDQSGNVIVTTSTQKPDLTTNLAYSLIEGVFRVVEKGVEMSNVDSLPSLYQIVKGSIINVELYSKGEQL